MGEGHEELDTLCVAGTWILEGPPAGMNSRTLQYTRVEVRAQARAGERARVRAQAREERWWGRERGHRCRLGCRRERGCGCRRAQGRERG